MAHTRASFLADFDTTWRTIINGNPHSPYRNSPFQAAHVGWGHYQTALTNARAGLIQKIGLFPHLQPLLPNFGSAFDNPPGRLFITRQGQQGWQLYFNDCFILGGIHGHATFELQNYDVPINGDPELAAVNQIQPGFEQLDHIGQNAPAYRLKVTQREVFGLNCFGYSEQNSQNNIRRMTCQLQPKADAATLRSYKEIVDEMAAVV